MLVPNYQHHSKKAQNLAETSGEACSLDALKALKRKLKSRG